MLHRAYEKHKQIRRQLIDLNVASNKRVFNPSLKVKGNNNNVSLWPDRSDLDIKSDGLKTVNTVLQDGSDLLGTPARWLKDMQQNWLIYMVVIAIILVCVLFLYFIIRCHCLRGRKSSTKTSCIAKLRAIMASNNTIASPPPKLLSEQETAV